MRRASWTPVAIAALGAVALGCSHAAAPPPPPAADAAEAPPAADDSVGAIARAEDLRRSADVPESARESHDAAKRRRAAEALARIADAASLDASLRALADEDEPTAAWGAYALGFACKGHEEAYVRALAARSASVGVDEAARPGHAPEVDGGAPPRDRIDVRTAIARALGRCGGDVAEQLLASWVRARGHWAERAAYALGDVAGRRGELREATMAALADAATATPQAPAMDVALYPFARIERVPDTYAARLIAAARAALARPSATRIFAVRALARCGRDAIVDLARVATSRAYLPAERAEAARGLATLGETGRAAAADALARVTPDSKDAVAIASLVGDDFGVIRALVAAVGTDVPKRAESAIEALASLTTPASPSGTPAPLARRVAELRCGAAGALAKGAYDAEVLRKCDAEGSEPWERARLAALLKRTLVGERRGAWRALTRSDHVRVREAALEAIAQHPELGDAARTALLEALTTKKGGIVATAAEVITAHPDRAMVLAESEKRAALDPAAPPPSAEPRRSVDPSIASALKGDLERTWPEDLVETKAAILDAAVSVGISSARDAALAACRDRNATMRERGAKALRALGDPSPQCAHPPDGGAAASEVAHPLKHDTRVRFVTDAGVLSIVFEPELAPVAATRFVALARGGFYKGLVVHRVVPGFVAQFGDPDGDGFGGSGQLLRCETSPVPFEALDVGVALAGRDTGSSQLFVTLARTPHLDGEYARVGRAEGDWWALAEGDAIRDVEVVE